MRRRRNGHERSGEMRIGNEKERKGKEESAGEYGRTQGEKSNHVCPAEVTTGLQVLIMC